MSPILTDRLLKYFLLLTTEFVDRGVNLDEACELAAHEIRRQLRESNGDLVNMLMDQAIHGACHACEHGTTLH